MTMSSCAGTHAMAMRQPLSFDGVHNFLDTLFDDDLHAKRVKSLAGATLGAIQSASLAVGLIGQGLALARGRLTKHAVKQVDRLLSNQGIDVDALLVHWVPYVVGKRDSITVAMDWTEFDADGQATIMLSLLSRHGRATPLVWLTVDKATLKTVATATSIRSWCAWPKSCPPMSVCASWPIAALATTSSIGC
jgi:hypothetical protein